MTTQNKLFLILGIHRSGTSATAGVLHHLGVNMGDDLIGANISNMKGHFENASFVTLNDQILRLAGGEWDNPPDRDQILKTNHHLAAIKEFMDGARKPVWGLKDPRFVITYEVWKPYLERENITYIFVHRPFQASVSSLVCRNGFREQQAVRILNTYWENLNYYRAELGQGNEDIIDVNYEELVREPSFFVYEINRRLEISDEHNLDLVSTFLDEKLRHF
jgi:hypothetical protein